MKIELDHVSKYYELPGGGGKRDVLKDVSVTLQPGDSLAIVGPSGSGKSTLLNLIGALDKPSDGSVRFNEEDIWKMNDGQLAQIRNKHIGFVFQMHYLLPQLTLFENVLLPLVPGVDQDRKKQGRDRALELLQHFGLLDKLQQRPGQMSVGECQRTAVARALMNEPAFILADEPTGSLDQRSADTMGELLSDINKLHNVAVIVVTHSEKLAGKMKTTWHLVDGNLVKS